MCIAAVDRAPFRGVPGDGAKGHTAQAGGGAGWKALLPAVPLRFDDR